MSFVRTMTGDILPEEMGFTYSHEHIVCRPAYWMERGQVDLLLDDPAKSEEEVRLAKAAGVDTIVDATNYLRIIAVGPLWTPRRLITEETRRRCIRYPCIQE